MANVGVRSPYFVSMSNASGEYFKVEITINSTLRYTLAKVTPDEAHFEISELIRDYIDIEYNGTMPTYPGNSSSGWSADVSIDLKIYDNTAGTGTPISDTTVTFDAYDAYAFFEDQDEDFTLPANGVLLTSRTIWLPEDTAGVFYYTASDVVTKYNIGTTTVGNISVAGTTVTVKRTCSKYDPIKVVFVNRFGMPQELWFFGKTIESSSFSSDQYKSSSITAGGVYSKYEHQYKKLNAKGKKRYIINTGFVAEEYNDSIDEMMMSEQVWMHVDNTVRPINIMSSDVSYRTSLNDKVVEYTLEVEQANDLISTMR